jgi:hypothetical protein
MSQPDTPHPALADAKGWPALPVWVVRRGHRITFAALAPHRRAREAAALLPCDSATLTLLGQIATRESRARLFLTHLDPEHPHNEQVVLCPRGTPGAVRIRGSVAAVADTLLDRTRDAIRRMTGLLRQAGRYDGAVVWHTMSGALLLAGRDARRRHDSVHTTSGGLPTLGKHSG